MIIPCEGCFTIEPWYDGWLCVRNGYGKAITAGTYGQCLAWLARQQFFPMEWGTTHEEREDSFLKRFPVLAKHIAEMVDCFPNLSKDVLQWEDNHDVSKLY